MNKQGSCEGMNINEINIKLKFLFSFCTGVYLHKHLLDGGHGLLSGAKREALRGGEVLKWENLCDGTCRS